MDTKENKTKIKPNEFSPLLGFLIILLAFVCWMNFGPMLSFAIYSIPAFQEGVWAGVGDYLIVHAPYILMFLALFLGSNFVLKTKLRELICGTERKYRYSFSLLVALFYVLFLAIISLLEFKTIDVNTTPFPEKLRLLLPILILTPMQALSEELFFRALPARLVYKNNLPKTWKESIAIVLISGFLFLVPHMGNPEFTANVIFSGLYYFLWGSLAMALALYTDGFEAPVAMHIANNLYIALVVNYSHSSMPTQAIFINNGETSSIFSVVEVLAVFSIIFGLSYYLKKNKKEVILGKKNG